MPNDAFGRERTQRMQDHRRMAIRQAQREARANGQCTCGDKWMEHAGPMRACTVCPCDGFTSKKQQGTLF